MNTVFQDFQTRASEVEGYFDFVVRLADKELVVQSTLDGTSALSNHASEDLLKTLKASCYLLLYNLIESTMRNAVEAIFEELKVNRTSFDECRWELREEILRNFKKRSTDKLLSRLITIACDVIHETFEGSEIFGGNLDARTIRKTAVRFGFEPPVGSQFHLLQTVKDVRNDLAHGVKSFAEVGRNASTPDLMEAKEQTIEILRQTLENIQIYLSGQLYLMPR